MANDISSPGLMGLPHFRSSRISQRLWEPIYLNLFTVEIALPLAITMADDYTDESKNLLLEGIKKVGGLDTNKVPGVTTQHYKFAERSFANSGPENTYIDVTLDFDVNVMGSADGNPTMEQVKILRRWDDLIYDPLTGRQGLKVDYVAPYAIITMHDKAQQPFWMWKLYNVFPTKNITMPDLEYMKKGDLYSISGYTLRCDCWDEYML